MPYASINGQEIYYRDSGSEGYPVVMMHGFLMDQSLFDPQVHVLAPEYRCIRFDARAFGETKWDGKAFNLYDTASDCVKLMDHLGIRRAVIVGMSQGGYAAFRVALKYPERVSALVLMSTFAGVESDEEKPMYRGARDAWAAHGPTDDLINHSANMLLGPKYGPAMQKVWDHWIPRWKARTKEAMFHAMNNLIDRDDVSCEVYRVMQPALVTHGEADVGMPIQKGRELSKSLKNCQGFIAVPEAAHAANFTHPEPINSALLEFLAKATR